MSVAHSGAAVRRRSALLGGLLVACFSLRVWAGDAVERLVETLASAPSYKVRIQAAAVLARMKDPRVVSGLGRAAIADPHPLVRGLALKLLGFNPGGDATDGRARMAITRGLTDEIPQVRTQAKAALTALDHLKMPAAPTTRAVGGNHSMSVAVGPMGDRSGHASAMLRERMRTEITRNLSQVSSVTVAAPGSAGLAYVVDGVIRKLDFVTKGDDVETVCAVELVVSRPPRGIVLVASGEAIVQKPKIQFRPHLREPMEAEALQHAVKSAHENLAKFLANQ